MKTPPTISNRLRTLVVLATITNLLGAATFTARADANWDGDNAIGNFSYTDNFYCNSAGGCGGYGFGGSLHFSLRNNSSQTSQYQDVGWQNEDNLYWDSSWPVDTTFNANGSSGISFNQRIENDSSHVITLNCPTSGAKNGATQIELNPVNGDLIINGNVYNDNNKPFHVYGANSKLLTIGVGLTGNSSVSLTIEEYSKVKLTAAQSWGDSTHGVNINRGEFWMDSGGSLASSSVPITVGLSDGNVAKLWLSFLTGGLTLNNNLTVNNQSSGPTEKTIGGLNTSGTSTFGGTVTLNGQVNLSAATGGTVAFNGVVSGTSQNVVVNGYGLPLTGIITMNAANTYSGNTYISGGTLQFNSGGSAASSPNFYLGETTGSQTATLALGATSGGQALYNPITVRSGSSGTKTISGLATSSSSTLGGSITLNDNLTVSSASGGNLILGGIISGSSYGLTLAGAGTVTLSGANTYGGNTSISVGQLNLNNSKAIGTGTLTFGGNATFDNTTGSAITLANNNALTLSGGSPTFTGSSDLNFGTGPVTLQTAGRTITTSAGALTLGGTISGAGLGLTKAGNGTLVLNGPLATTTGTLTVSAGTLTLAGNNTYSGATTLSSGSINMNSSTAFGTSSSVAMNGITLDNTSGSAITLANNNPISLGGNNTFTGSSDLNLGSGTVTLTAGRTWTVNAGNLTLGGGVTDTGTARKLSKNGLGTLILNGAAGTWSGGAEVDLGTLAIGSDTALGTGTLTFAGGTIQSSGGARSIANAAVITTGNGSVGGSANFTFNSSGTLTSSGGSRTLTVNNSGTTTLAGNVYLSDNNTTSGRGLTLNGSGNVTISAPIANNNAGNTQAASLAYSGSGTLTLSGANTYTGGTTVSGGTLLVNNSTGSGTGSGTVTVNSGGTLGGSGTLSGAVTIGSGSSGTLSPGSSGSGSIGTLTFGSTLTLGSSSASTLEINKAAGPVYTADKAAVSGAVTFGGTLNVSATGTPLNSSDSFALFAASGFGGWFSTVSLPVLSPGLSWDTNDLATTGVLDIYTFTTNSVQTMSAVKNTATTLLISKLTSKTSGARGTVTLSSVSSASGASVSISGGNINYTPPTAFTGIDTFSAVLTDGHGTINATVVVTVNAVNATSRITDIVVTNGASATLTASGMTNQVYNIQASDDLGSTWSTIATVTSAPNGLVRYIDTTQPSHASRYYRLAQP